jgi:hypothetical protein
VRHDVTKKATNESGFALLLGEDLVCCAKGRSARECERRLFFFFRFFNTLN